MNRVISTFLRLLQWTIFTVGLAAIVHVGIVVYTPSFVMSRLIGQLSKTSGINTTVYPDLPTHESRQVVKPSPDLLYTICTYNLTNGPLRITASIPEGHYWSLSIYGDNSDNFFVINDRQAGGDMVDLILVGTGTRLYNPQKLPIIEAESFSGVILTRTLVSSGEDAAMLSDFRRNTTCSPYVAPPKPPADTLVAP